MREASGLSEDVKGLLQAVSKSCQEWKNDKIKMMALNILKFQIEKT